MTEAVEPSEAERLVSALIELTSKVDKLNRVLLGAEDEGTAGIVARLLTVERKLEKMWWTFPLLVLSGTAIGQIAARLMGM